MVGKTALNKEMKHLNSAYFRTIINQQNIIIMSYNLSFWKYKENSYLDNHKVYETLCDEGNIEGLENVPVDEIREKIAKAFSDWNKVDENSFENSNKGAFQITTTSQSVMIDCYGMDGEDMNKFIDILFEYGCPLYDPQVGERYDDND